MADVLEVDHLDLSFGGQQVLDDVSFAVAEGQTVALIGPNGAGKTSIFNCVSRSYEPQSGDIRLGGQSLLNLAPHRLAGLGVARTFQSIELMPGATVLDNVLLGAHPRSSGTWVEALLNVGRTRRSERQLRFDARQALSRVGLDGLESLAVADLPYGRQKLVEIARCLISEPRLILLDEPVAGLNTVERAEIAALFAQLRSESNVALLVVEHDVSFVRDVAEYVIALDFGQVIARGAATHVLSDPKVTSSWLGDAHQAAG